MKEMRWVSWLHSFSISLSQFLFLSFLLWTHILLPSSTSLLTAFSFYLPLSPSFLPPLSSFSSFSSSASMHFIHSALLFLPLAPAPPLNPPPLICFCLPSFALLLHYPTPISCLAPPQAESNSPPTPPLHLLLANHMTCRVPNPPG